MISKEKLATLKKIGKDNIISKEKLESERTRITLLRAEVYDSCDNTLLIHCEESLEWINTALELYKEVDKLKKKLNWPF